MFRNIVPLDFEREENRFWRNMGSRDLCNLSVAWRDYRLLFIILSKSFVLTSIDNAHTKHHSSRQLL